MLELLQRSTATAFRRLRGNLSYTLGFSMLGAVTGALNQLPGWMSRYDEMGADAFFARMPRDAAGAIAATVLLMLVLRLCTEKASDLLRRPLVFVAIMVASTLVATWIGTSLHVALSNGRIVGYVNHEKLLTFWLDAMLWFGLVGWLYLLALQRAELRTALAGLLGRRAALGRQLAHARLGTMRAQVDPAEVAGVLVEVRIAYRADPAAAAAKLDDLIGRLRRAMSRVRHAPQGNQHMVDRHDDGSEHDVAHQTGA